MKNNKYKLDSDLIQSELDKDQVQQFYDNLKFVGLALDEHQPVPSDGFNDRIKAAVNAELDSNNSTILIIRHHIKTAMALAAMLLVVFSLVFYHMGPNDSDTGVENSPGAVAIAVTSDNPFAQPDLIMEVLMEQQGANSIDGMTLEAVSAMWGQENQNDQDNSSTNWKGNNNESVV